MHELGVRSQESEEKRMTPDSMETGLLHLSFFDALGRMFG